MPAPSASSHELVIEAGRTERTYWRDLWRYRELLGMLAWRDVKVRYSQTLLGAAWALVQPLASVAIFTFVFGRLAKMPAGNEPYFIVVMTGQMAWQLFANALGNTSGSLVGSAHLISKVYFPRLVVPLSTLLVALIDFAIVLLVYALAAGWTATLPSWKVIFLPAFIMTVLIGPRAEWERLVETYEREIPCYHFRHLVKPGITGWAQVNYPYGASLEDAARKLEYDLYYIRHFSFTLDAAIVLKTVHTVLGGKGR